jgi:hypothetical protein
LQLPLRDQPKYARFKGAENHSISSIDLTKTSSILAVLDILYRGEVGLAPLDTCEILLFCYRRRWLALLPVAAAKDFA